jgi:hypothetical protein
LVPTAVGVAAGVQPAQHGQLTDLRGGQLGVGGEVEAFKGDLFFELCPAQPPGHADLLAAGDLILAKDPQELQVPELPGAGLAEPDVESVEHPGQLQRAQRLAQPNPGDHCGPPGVRTSPCPTTWWTPGRGDDVDE